MPLTLRQLEGRLMKSVDDRAARSVNTVAEADGVFFLCPKCFETNKGPVGTHGVHCWFKGVPDSYVPGPGRWNPSGTTIDDLSLVPPGMCSVQLNGGCNAHFLVTNGQIAYC